MKEMGTHNQGGANLMVREDSGFQWLPNSPSKTGIHRAHEMRLVPSYTDGKRDPIYVKEIPEGDKRYHLQDCLGPFACSLKIVSWFRQGMYLLPGVVRDESRGQGDPNDFPPMITSPAADFCTALKDKLEEQTEVARAGYRTEISENEIRQLDRALNWPQSLVAFQAMFCKVDGDPVVTPEGQPTWRFPGVVIPRASARKDFLRKAVSRKTTSALSLENNELGDFISPEGGYTLYIERAGGDQVEYLIKLGRQMPLEEGWLSNTWKPWGQVLNVPSAEEVMTLLVRSFEGWTLDYAFRGTEWYDMLPERVKGSADRIRPRGDTGPSSQVQSGAGGAPGIPAAPAAPMAPPPAFPETQYQGQGACMNPPPQTVQAPPLPGAPPAPQQTQEQAMPPPPSVQAPPPGEGNSDDIQLPPPPGPGAQAGPPPAAVPPSGNLTRPPEQVRDQAPLPPGAPSGATDNAQFENMLRRVSGQQ